ncbi:hypothetical protein SEUCBS140593_009124 [Sporothrix eucalyptigena]|uniref:Uncharacterized protein n=1 Tax=Sporothrix eucalyptigena TaxID=1812306 RepID=A0ABP0CS69_9PEZI
MVGYQTGLAYNNVNRDHLNPLTGRWTQGTNLTGPVDPEVQVLTFSARNGTPIAAYTSYAMHPVQSYLTGYTSADWPGAMAAWVEESLGGPDNDFILIYCQQASGDVNPRQRRTGTNVLASIGNIPINGLELVQEPIEEPIRDQIIPLVKGDPFYVRQLFQQLTALGIVVGEEVIRVISSTADWDENPAIWGKRANATCPGRLHISNEREGVPGVYTNGPDINVVTGAIGLGDIAIAQVGAEIYTRIGWAIKDKSPMKKTMLITMANAQGLSGYIPDTLSVGHETFQALGCKIVPGDCAETQISETVAGLISEYVNSTTYQ